MLLSEVLKRLYSESKYKSINELSNKIDLSKSFINRSLKGEMSMIKIDKLFHEFTRDISIEDLFHALSIIKNILKNQKNESK